ncbi:SDR family NAD(P)-dependent oxidoreductase [Vicingaceae bacterium]|nr:SDR family NAD(P)-dependent oxidoreductase [Vicingaceae bacterium]MDC1452435.1 SDR family NAD(P)-dependent oxidoreductase [Vicingaceae bacterium]|tara:strand:+ start:9600 stop:10424 length:825 start_codon:yes stop_codon:yes gene_type:complete
MNNSKSDSRKKVLIIGANSQVGSQLVDKFSAEGWVVFATVSSKKGLPKTKTTEVNYFVLNLQKPKSIFKTISRLIKREDKIDALINSAGLVFSGPIESFSEEQIRRQMEVNFFGVVAVIKAILPVMRHQKSGVIANVSSLCGLLAFPMLSIYHASKWALEGFSESIYYELQEFGIQIKLIEPGGIKQNSYEPAIEFAKNPIEEYERLRNKVHSTNWFPSFTEPQQVATIIYEATTDGTNRLRYLIGSESKAFISERGNVIENERYLQDMKNRFN